MAESAVDNVRAVILAGGKGMRLRPLTTVLPKPLVPLGNKPILEVLMRRLGSFGLKDISICTGYLAEIIMAVCGDGAKYDARISYSGEEKPLGTAAPLARIPDLPETVIVMNGDLLTTLDFGKMIEFHKAQQADFTIGVYKRDVKIDFGVVQSDDDGLFTGFIEKPTYHYEVSMGVNVINREVIAGIDPDEYLDMPDLIQRVHDQGGKVALYREDCYWLDIGRMDDYATAQEEFAGMEDQFLGIKK
ncbi:sugar phosphate nucleotidyltransferase [endosymbiont of Ridgeia piscesae]|jgi:NDP-sugar pyrophosphorylase family protein|uniref:Nucleotidyl transferase n=1 Tax=endosymbiont of Ridgeia piscesae TaxID=54398 RepID=A0A0T5YWJ4_9GAMM|nr:sugar phosphate nucleotidyltransferase [endosymbiont of Ridgeia piscesae]KRT55040.1 Nucleotidyl transferase [endosymbiont of Ridgeia piscesae]KRT59697.1 Nucleotidyl transferase [endosymbiont of Ridgeia piscesae]